MFSMIKIKVDNKFLSDEPCCLNGIWMTMIFFEKERIIFSGDLLENGKIGREVYGRMGDHCAKAM